MTGFNSLSGVKPDLRHDIRAQAIHTIHFQPGGSVVVDVEQPAKLVLRVRPFWKPISRRQRGSGNNGVDGDCSVGRRYFQCLNIAVEIGDPARIRDLDDVGGSDLVTLFVVL